MSDEDELYQAKKYCFEEKKEKKIKKYESRAKKAKEKSEQAFNSAKRLSDSIPSGQPVLIGHHSEKHARKDISRIQRGMEKGIEEEQKSFYYEEKVTAAENNKAISSDDPDAIEKLKKKLENLELIHAFKLKCNSEWKKHLKDPDYKMKLTEQEEAKMLSEIQYYGNNCQPFPSFSLTSDTAKIREVKNRIAKLERYEKNNTKNKYYSFPEIPKITFEENVVENRFKIYVGNYTKDQSFKMGLPALFHKMGFVWAGSEKVYQRKLTSIGYIKGMIIDELKKVFKNAPLTLR